MNVIILYFRYEVEPGDFDPPKVIGVFTNMSLAQDHRDRCLQFMGTAVLPTDFVFSEVPLHGEYN